MTAAMTAHGNLADGYSATLLPSGQVLIAGGEDDESVSVSAELYDPRTATFTTAGNMTKPQRGHTATPLTDGTVFMTGYGLSAELYDPASGRFNPAGGQ